MHLAAWLDAMGIAWDAITDHDLEREGAELLSRYKCVLTGTHPEYQSIGTLNAVRDYVGGGGRHCYMGGNGFYWRVAVSADVPDTLELRRTESGTRAWAAEPGEYFHAFDAGYGGLWRRQDRTRHRVWWAWALPRRGAEGSLPAHAGFHYPSRLDIRRRYG